MIPPVRPYGLSEVYRPPGNELPTVDIVFVHGLNGNAHDTWTSKSNCFWPSELLPKTLAPLKPRILTYGYNSNVISFTNGASTDSIVSHAETLVSTLGANRNIRADPKSPIIWVCHSLGGLVVKRALIHSRSLSSEKTDHGRALYVSTYGILFLGTPHNGSDIAKWGLLLHNIFTAVVPKKFMEGSPQLIQSLRTNSDILQNINALFSDMMGRYRIYFFHETQSTDLKGTRQKVVDEMSAAPYIDGVERMGIEADHSHMCKFEDADAPGYEVVAEAILRYSHQAPKLISQRWQDEEYMRSQEMRAKARELYSYGWHNPSSSMFIPHDNGLTIAESDALIGHSMPDLNTAVTRNLPRAPATEGRNSPVSDLANSALQVSQFSTKETQFFVAPPGFHPNKVFFGMTKELESLHNRLFKAKRRVYQLASVLITGTPGSGKTHLARQYVFTYRQSYPGGIFWIDGRSRESVFKGFWEIAQAVPVIDNKEAKDLEFQQTGFYVDSVRKWLEKRQDWLLVFDGLSFESDEALSLFKPFLPWGQRCSILYTSIDKTLRRKQRLFEPFCLTVSPLRVDDACRLLFKDLGIKVPTKEQAIKAREVVQYFECLPLAIHAIGHRLSAVGKPLEKYRVKRSVTDAKLAEPYLIIMNDLCRLEQKSALYLVNLLSFLGHHVPVALLTFGKQAIANAGADILTSGQIGEEPDLDTTLGILIRHGLIERSMDADQFSAAQMSPKHSSDSDEKAKPFPELTSSLTETSQEGFFSIYRGTSAVDVVKIHNVLQGFCRDELRIKDDENYKEGLVYDLSYQEMWLVAATQFLCTSYYVAQEKMAHYNDCGIVRDHREYETHVCTLLAHFPKSIKSKASTVTAATALRTAKDHLKRVQKSLKEEIDRLSPGSSEQETRRQKSVFEQSSSSSEFSPSSTEEESPGAVRRLTWDWTETEAEFEDSPAVKSPNDVRTTPKFRLDVFPPHIFREGSMGYESGNESDRDIKETKNAVEISPSLSGQATFKPEMLRAVDMSPSPSQTSQATIKPFPHAAKLPASQISLVQSSPPEFPDDCGWKVVLGSSKKSRRGKPPKLLKPVVPLVRLSSIEGKGSRYGNSSGEMVRLNLATARMSISSRTKRENMKPPSLKLVSVSTNDSPTWANIAARDNKAAQSPLLTRSTAIARDKDHHQFIIPYDFHQSQASSTTVADQAISISLPQELRFEPLALSTYSEPGSELWPRTLHTAPGSRRQSLAVELLPDLSASTPSAPRQHNVWDDVIVNRARPRPSIRDIRPASAPGFVKQAHPSVIMPGGLPHIQSAPEVPMYRSLDERLQTMNSNLSPDRRPGQFLTFGRHRIDVQGARDRMSDMNPGIYPEIYPGHEFYQPGLESSFVPNTELIYPTIPASALRPRSTSSPERSGYDGIGVRFA